MPARSFLAAAVLAIVAVPPALADQNETIVVTATRVPTAAEKLPASVTVITRQQIEQRGYTTLVEALSTVPGLRVAQSGGPGAQASVFIRGTESRHVLVLRDGVPVNDPGDPGNAFNFGVDTLGDVERIEIVRGPLSSLYGSGAIGGVINIITRHGAGAPHGELLVAGGLPRQGLVRASVSGATGAWDYRAGLESQSLLGFDQTPKRETGVYTGERDGDRSKQAEAEVGYTVAPDTRLSVLFRARDNKYGYDEQGGLVTYDGNNATGYDAQLFGRAALATKLLDGAWETTLSVARLQDDRRYRVTFDPLDPNGDAGDDRYHGTRTDALWHNLFHLPDWGPATAAAVTADIEHVNEGADSKTNDLFGGFPSASLVRAHDDQTSGSLGVQATLWQAILATAQVRRDETTLGNATTWHVGASAPLADWLRVHAAAGTGFRIPALFDRYGVDSFGYVGNPALRPETSEGYEAGADLTLPLPAAGQATLGATLFRTDLHDLIMQVFAPVYTSVNVARARAQGVEITAGWQWRAWLAVDASYTYTDARNTGTGAQLLRRPYDQAAADLRLTPVPGVDIVPELIYTGGFQDYLVPDSGAAGFATGLSPSGLIFNLNASWQVEPRLKLFVWGKNLGDSRFEPVSGYQAPGASFLAGVKLSL